MTVSCPTGDIRKRTTEAALPQFNGVAINGGFLLAAAPLARRPELLLIAL
jgi:hypothetical protein